MSPQREFKTKRNNVFRFFFPIILVGLLSFFGNSVKAQSLQDTLNVENNMKEIASQYNLPFWKLVFDANTNATSNSDSIKQSLDAPSFKEFAQNINQENKKSNVQKSAPENNQDSLTLKKFREAFEKVTNKKNVKESSNKEAEERIAKEKEIRNGLNIGGLVLNKTRSKMGRDFFNAFYEEWDPPEDIETFMLEVSEQPIPSMGAMVLVKIDNSIVYKARLQPRGSVINKKAEKSVAMCYRYIQQQTSSSKNLTY